jgi:hypothetical protein
LIRLKIHKSETYQTKNRLGSYRGVNVSGAQALGTIFLALA